MTQKNKSWQIDTNRIDALVKEIKSNSNSDISECKSEYEVLRARLDGKLVIVYSSGKVVFHDSDIITGILKKYGKISTKTKKKELKPINVRLNDEQKIAFIENLEGFAETADTPGEYEDAAFTLDGAKITVYTSGSVYSPHGHPKFEDAIVMTIRNYPTYPQYEIIIGQDEVGKGELFGPMIVGSVAVTQDQAVALQLAGARDSKDLNEQRISEIFDDIKANSIARCTIPMHAKRFNKLFEKFKEENKTLNDLLAWAHSKALEEVLFQLDKIGRGDASILVIIDEFSRVSTDKRLQKILKKKKFDLIQTPRAEGLSVAVAAASIMAKNRRNSDMQKLNEMFDIPLDRKNLDAILKHPKAPEVLRYSYIEKTLTELPPPNTIQGLDADVFLDQLLIQSRLETYYIDFKSEFPRNSTDIGKIIAGMANSDGGEIYYGILQETKPDSIEVIGVDSPQKLEERTSGISGNCEPSPKLDYTLFIRTDETKVLRVGVPTSSELVYFEHRYYKRVSSGAKPMTKYEIDNWPDSCRRFQ